MGAILAVADTNAAADNLLQGLLQRGIQAVRAALVSTGWLHGVSMQQLDGGKGWMGATA
jgi:hypothetical protein